MVSAIQIRCPQNKSAEGKMDLEVKLLEAKNELVYKTLLSKCWGSSYIDEVNLLSLVQAPPLALIMLMLLA